MNGTCLNALISDDSFYSLTSDLWASRPADNYLSLTAHWINESFVFCSSTVACRFMGKSKEAVNVGDN